MSYGLSTFAQRLQWQFADERAGLEDDLPLAEQHEIADDAFRHFDQFVFAPAPAKAPGRDHGRDRAAVSSDSSDGGPALTQSISLPAGGAAVFPPSGRSALLFEHHMWTP